MWVVRAGSGMVRGTIQGQAAQIVRLESHGDARWDCGTNGLCVPGEGVDIGIGLRGGRGMVARGQVTLETLCQNDPAIM